MEYTFFRKIQGIPRWIRILLGVITILFGILSSLVPAIPGAIPAFVIGLLFLVSARKIKKVRKIRRGLLHLVENFKWERIKHKWYDIKTHLKHIIFHD